MLLPFPYGAPAHGQRAGLAESGSKLPHSKALSHLKENLLAIEEPQKQPPHGQGAEVKEEWLIGSEVVDDARVKLKANYSGLGELWLPRTVLDSDFVVSMPKVKTHHWAGVTLSLKNMFGIVPGMKYGWPKNLLHWHGIHESILDICATVPIHFVIADGITAMEGNGPLQGTARELGKIVLADDPVAADATCARLMGFDPLPGPALVRRRAGSSEICVPTGSRCWPNG